MGLMAGSRDVSLRLLRVRTNGLQTLPGQFDARHTDTSHARRTVEQIAATALMSL